MNLKEQIVISLEEQNKQIGEAKLKCLQTIVYNLQHHVKDKNHCDTEWDGIACWETTPPGREAQQPCPAYVHGFYLNGAATRRCMSDGQWYFNSEYNRTWTNYSACTPPVILQPTHPAALLENHLERLKIMYHIGYAVSLLTLIVAVFLMVYFRRLRCPRNVVHLNLFVSFILRASLSFIKDGLLVEGLGLPDDVATSSLGTLSFIEEGKHWECKLLLTMFHYVLLANYMWLFIEGLYLHTLIIVAVFSEKSRIRWYIIFGWVCPLMFVVPWVIVRLLLEDKLCWNTNPTAGYLWIMKSPIVTSIIVNFAFFINIIRVLFTKLRNYSTPQSRRCRYRRLAKSTLILIPLFGVHYMVFIGVPDNMPSTLELIRLYYEMFFNSFEGFFVALLYCFLNREVQSEIRKKWIRYKLKTNSRKFQRIYWQTASSKLGRNPSQNHLMNSITSEKKGIRNPKLNTSSDNSSNSDKGHSKPIGNFNAFKLCSNINAPERPKTALSPEEIYG